MGNKNAGGTTGNATTGAAKGSAQDELLESLAALRETRELHRVQEERTQMSDQIRRLQDQLQFVAERVVDNQVRSFEAPLEDHDPYNQTTARSDASSGSAGQNSFRRTPRVAGGGAAYGAVDPSPRQTVFVQQHSYGGYHHQQPCHRQRHQEQPVGVTMMMPSNSFHNVGQRYSQQQSNAMQQNIMFGNTYPPPTMLPPPTMAPTIAAPNTMQERSNMIQHQQHQQQQFTHHQEQIAEQQRQQQLAEQQLAYLQDQQLAHLQEQQQQVTHSTPRQVYSTPHQLSAYNTSHASSMRETVQDTDTLRQRQRPPPRQQHSLHGRIAISPVKTSTSQFNFSEQVEDDSLAELFDLDSTAMQQVLDTEEHTRDEARRVLIHGTAQRAHARAQAEARRQQLPNYIAAPTHSRVNVIAMRRAQAAALQNASGSNKAGVLDQSMQLRERLLRELDDMRHTGTGRQNKLYSPLVVNEQQIDNTSETEQKTSANFGGRMYSPLHTPSPVSAFSRSSRRRIGGAGASIMRSSSRTLQNIAESEANTTAISQRDKRTGTMKAAYDLLHHKHAGQPAPS